MRQTPKVIATRTILIGGRICTQFLMAGIIPRQHFWLTCGAAPKEAASSVLSEFPQERPSIPLAFGATPRPGEPWIDHGRRAQDLEIGSSRRGLQNSELDQETKP
jgi:hypothetical protein